jgi:hypothetical protein
MHTLKGSEVMPDPKGTATVVDTYTGEVFDFAWKNAGELRIAFERAKKLEEAVKRAREKIQTACQEFLGDEEFYDFGDGFKFMWIASSTKRYPREVVAEFLDEDQLALVIDINGKRLKELLAALVKENRAPKDAWKTIEANAEIMPRKPYVKLEKAK